MITRLALKTAIAAACLTTALGQAASEPAAAQYYELRTYTTQSPAQLQRINDYWQHAAVPAYNRLGIHPIGVFTEIEESAASKIYVFIPFDGLAEFVALPAKLAADAVYQQAAAPFLNASKADAAYESVQSSLLVAFDGMKHLVMPPADPRPNVFELRTYISPSENKGLDKIRMFESGEITAMKEVGLAPVFYARTVAGSPLPSLVYLTCGEDLEAHKKHWQGFANAPVWKQLQADPQYKGTVSSAIKLMLKRTAASQL